jgi:hypothetical protein
MSPPSEVQVVAGEEQVMIRWKADDSAFLAGYTITRQRGSAEDWGQSDIRHYPLQPTLGHPICEFVDTEVGEEATYTYQVSTRFKSGAELHSELFTVTGLPVIKETALLQSYPNPCNPEVWIPYELIAEASVSVRIHNVAGQVVRTLELGVQPRGRYTSRSKAAYWDGRNELGERVSSGVYFYVLNAGAFLETRRMVLLK